MNKQPKRANWSQNKKGMALIMVVAMLTLATVMVLGLLSVTSMDYKGSKVYSTGQRARLLADSATDIVIAQLQAASRQEGDTRTFHATQPGAVRKYNSSGAFIAGYKLFSDSEMVVRGRGATAELRMVNTPPPDDWNSEANAARYVDLNEPVVRPGRTGDGSIETFFPVVDPRAFRDDSEDGGSAPIEGFEYGRKTYSGTSLAGVVTPSEATDANGLRLPMPVQWLYVLKDGTLGFLDASNKFIPAGGSEPSAENPIVGRVAFWTDDETCKVNINTASEPTFWAVPTVLHEREWRFAEYPPAMNEYQRFPGHPATVALSAIFYPKVNLDLLASGANVSQIRNIKERIYDIIPKINRGGSRCGTVAFGPETFGEDQATTVDVLEARKERLFASLDELLFSEDATAGKRVENDFMVDGVKLMDAASLERTRFFLTAHSRGSDVNFLGLPKVAMWPIADESKGRDYRTGFDHMIAFCSTLSASGSGEENSYYFRRIKAHSAAEDINIRRNDQLMSYLDRLMAKTFPAGASGNGQSFATKYGKDDARQILVSIFDYIRTTNLYDAMLAKKPDELQNLYSGSGKNYSGNYQWQYENTPTDSKTYTEERFKTTRTGATIVSDEIYNGSFPGHGAVTPAEWRPSGSNTSFRGQGRFPTVSEVALHFICTGDGNHDEGSYRIPKKEGEVWVRPPFEPGNEAVTSGGKTAKKYRIDVLRSGGAMTDPRHDYNADDWARESMPDKFLGAQKAVWYSNYPPYPQDPNGRGSIDSRQPPLYGTDLNAPLDSPLHPSNHPGYKPENWNATLQRGVPLKAGEKRVQACIHLESFVSALGWTKVHPELTYVLDGDYISQIQVQNSTGAWVSLFSTTADTVVKSRANLYDGYSTHPVGGVGNFRSLALGKHVKGVGSMPDDPSYYTATSDLPHVDINNMDLVSNFITVSGAELRFRFPAGHFLIKVYDTHAWKRAEPVQEIRVAFPAGTHAAPVPELVTYTSLKDTWVSGGTTYNQRITDAVRWWAFNFAGAMNRYRGNWVSGRVTMPSRTEYLSSSQANYNELLRSSGRLRLYDHASNNGNGGAGGARHIPATRSFIWGFDPNSGHYKGVNPQARDASLPKYAWGTDVIRSVMPRHGDYRLLAARKEVTEDFWVPSPLWSDATAPFAHSLSAHHASAEPGFHRGGTTYGTSSNNFRLVQGANYNRALIHDSILNVEATKSANAYGDFDNGVGTSRDGAYINKPDEGNLSQLQKNFGGQQINVRNAYFLNSNFQAAATESFFTPNRMVTSPVMFGSLPTGVWGSRAVSGSHPNAATFGVPWRTLLFRPHVKYPGVGSSLSSHPGSPLHAKTAGATPADHYLLELFRMPVVEPYAISDPFSTAGKINLNFQMIPFTHIKRSTALHALMKGEMMRTVPKAEASIYKSWRATSSTDWESYKMHSEKEGTPRYWHHKIDVEKTLKQFDERFDFTARKTGAKGLFRTASQLCEVHLIPARTSSVADASLLPETIDSSNREQVMAKFWEANSLTGDNSREASYSNLYARATTQSNVFKVYVRAQTITKARSGDPGVFDPNKDTVTGAYRGSAIVERYIDTKDAGNVLPDYAAASDPFTPHPLSDYYRFRVVESKRFSP